MKVIKDVRAALKKQESENLTLREVQKALHEGTDQLG